MTKLSNIILPLLVRCAKVNKTTGIKVEIILLRETEVLLINQITSIHHFAKL